MSTVEPGQGNSGVRLEVELDGQHHEMTVRKGEALLDAMLREGLSAPYSCRNGECGTCMCTLVSGKVHLRNNEVLDRDDLERGWILACQALPDTPSIKVRFPES